MLVLLLACVLYFALRRPSPRWFLTRMERLAAWFEETHSAGFELRRHFFFRFFDSELISSPGQWKVVAGGALAIVLSLSIVYIQAYFHKYRLLSELESPEPYRLAAMADVLFLVALSMLLSGLFTTLQWPSLFPGLRDYLALAGLPIRMRELFVARFTALLAVAAIFITASTLPPSISLPVVMAGRHGASAPIQIVALFVSCFSAAWFVFFSLVVAQGVLLNILPTGLFPRVSLAMQGILLAVLLCGSPLVFSISSLNNHMSLRPHWTVWVPAMWYLGLDQVIAGNREALGLRLALIGLVAVIGSALAALCTYLWSYRRHKVRLLESQSGEGAAGALWPAGLSDRIIPDSRELAVFAFIAKILGRSRPHRLILTAFSALALALIVESFVSLALSRSFRGFDVPTPALRQAAISAPLALSLFVLCGFRYLFRLPVELRANWIFRMNEPGNRLVLLAGVERFLLYCAVLPVALMTLPMEVLLLGTAAGCAASLMCLLVSLNLMEFLLIPSDKIPFTSSYMPGRRPLIETVLLYGMAVGAYVTALCAIISWSVQSRVVTVILISILTACWWKARRVRMDVRKIGRLEFEEQLEPAVQILGIERD